MRVVLPVILLIFFLLAPVSTFATSYYVDYSLGNDTNDGTSLNSQWKSTAKVNSTTFSPGDVILFKRGEVWPDSNLKIPTSGTVGKPITFDAYGSGSKPIIQTYKSANVNWVPVGQNIWKTTNRLALIKIGNNQAILQTTLEKLKEPYQWYRNEGVTVAETFIYATENPATLYPNQMYVGTSTYGIEIGNKSNIILRNLQVEGGNRHTIYAIGNGETSNLTIDSVDAKYAFYSNIVVRNLQGAHILNSKALFSNRDGILVNCQTSGISCGNHLLEKNVSHNHSMAGIHVSGMDSSNRQSGTIVRNNTTYQNGDGIYLHYSTNILVSENISKDNFDRSFAGEGYGVGLQTVSNSTIEANIFTNNRTRGIEIWGGVPSTEHPQYGRSDNNKVLRNSISKNGSFGFFISANYVSGTVIAFNTIFKNKSHGVLIIHPDNTGTKVYNNTIVENNGAGALANSSKFDFVNNILAKNLLKSTLSGTVISNNLVFSEPDITVTNAVNTIKADPQFLNPGTDNYHISNSSPAKGAGTQISGNFRDIDGDGIQLQPDIGSDQFTTPTLTNTPTPTTAPDCTKKALGDANCDSKTSLVDFELFRRGLFKKPESLMADFNGDKVVTLNDYRIWLTNFIF
jgi:parallel beta-helix repeat protein